jgi:hypothetical protein
VDPRWGKTPEKVYPESTSPQSHLSNARSNYNWEYRQSKNVPLYENMKPREIKGRLYWPSDPTLISVTYDDVSKISDHHVQKIEVLSSVANCAWWKR